MLPMLLTGCDSVEPANDNLLVIEGFFNAGAPLPLVTISKASPLEQSTASTAEFIRDASFKIFIDDQEIIYTPSSSSPGKYAPLDNTLEIVPANADLRAEITWQSQKATTQDFIPPSISIDSVSIDIPEQPVAAILVDTLRLDNPEVGARQGYIYAIDVAISWTASHSDLDAADSDSSYWVEARLIPQTDFSSTVLDVFLLTEDVQLESKLTTENTEKGSWSGIYAIPVADSLSPPPTHNLTVQLIRGTKAYADFAASKNAPERREPVSNIDGAIGVLAGIALDAIEFEVTNGLATTRR
ncbi:MAG: DUF4249 family protein [Rhodothermales bacterium]